MIAIEIAVRVRPRSNQELENNVGEEPIIEDHLEPSGSTSLTTHGGKWGTATEKQFSCDRYYSSTASQEKMFQRPQTTLSVAGIRPSSLTDKQAVVKRTQ
jgi:hypothetical protein